MRNKVFRSHPARVRPIVTQRDYEAAREVLKQTAHQIQSEDDEERIEALIREIDDFEAHTQTEPPADGVDPPSDAWAATPRPIVVPAESTIHGRRWSDPLAASTKPFKLLVRLTR